MCTRKPVRKCSQLFITAAAATAKSLHSCPTLCNPIDSSPPGSPVPGTLQARILEWKKKKNRILEWVAISFSNAWKWKVKVKSLSCVRLLVISWTAAYQAPPCMGFSRQEYWSGLPLPSPVHNSNNLQTVQMSIHEEQPNKPCDVFTAQSKHLTTVLHTPGRNFNKITIPWKPSVLQSMRLQRVGQDWVTQQQQQQFSRRGYPGGSVLKKLPVNAGDECLIPGSGRSPRGGNGNSLQYSCLGNPMDGKAWQAIV